MKYTFRLFLLALAVICAAGIYLWHRDGLRYYSVQTGSMRPALGVGSLVIDEKVSPANVKKGDIVSYITPSDPRVIITHRVIGNNKSRNLLTTRGDNLVSPDPPAAYTWVIGREVKVLPYAGYLMDAIRNPLGLVAIIYIPVICVAIIEVRKLARRSAGTYKHHSLAR